MDDTGSRVETSGVVLAGLGRPPTLEKVAVHSPGFGEVRVRMLASGICHTDLNAVRNAGVCPMLLGHEGGLEGLRKWARESGTSGGMITWSLTQAAVLGCAVATGVGAVLYTSKVRPNESVVVIGAGGVGLNVVQVARLANASPIIAIDADGERLLLARKFGATHSINSRTPNLVAQVKELTAGRGVEHAFEVVGTPELMLQGVGMLARGGALTLVGGAARDALSAFHPRRFMSQQQLIRGCIYGNIRPEVDLPMFADWYMEGRLHLDELVGESVGLEEVPEIFKHPQRRRGIRTIIKFDQHL